MPLTAEQIENSRSEFEEWFNQLVSGIESGAAENTISTVRFHKEIHWISWLARQETLCVEIVSNGWAEVTPYSMGDVVKLSDGSMGRIAAEDGIAHK